MPEAIHIVEPTLVDARGHCKSLVSSFCAAAPDSSFAVWADRRATPDLLGVPNASLKPWFHRRVRVPQCYLLYRRLLRHAGRVFVPTAGRTDVVLMDRALGSRGPTDRAVLFVHWLRATESRLASLKAVARRRPHMRLLASTPSVMKTLKACGFARARYVPYPVTSQVEASEGHQAFSHVLFAGAARRDKGFHRFVELVEAMARAGTTWPVVCQTGGDYYDRQDPVIRSDLDRLDQIEYGGLETLGGGLPLGAYRALFQGAVAIQLYEPDDFVDRASGVTLDALSVGAPILTFTGTWMARQVERFGAGLAVAPDDPASWFEALRSLVREYPHFSEAAARAGQVLAEEYSPRRLVEAVLS